MLSRLFNHFVRDAAVDKLASHPTFQRFAVTTVDGIEAAKRKLDDVASGVAEDPVRAAVEAQAQVGTFWEALKGEVARDVYAWTGGKGDAGDAGDAGEGKR